MIESNEVTCCPCEKSISLHQERIVKLFHYSFLAVQNGRLLR